MKKVQFVCVALIVLAGRRLFEAKSWIHLFVTFAPSAAFVLVGTFLLVFVSLFAFVFLLGPVTAVLAGMVGLWIVIPQFFDPFLRVSFQN